MICRIHILYLNERHFDIHLLEIKNYKWKMRLGVSYKDRKNDNGGPYELYRCDLCTDVYEIENIPLTAPNSEGNLLQLVPHYVPPLIITCRAASRYRHVENIYRVISWITNPVTDCRHGFYLFHFYSLIYI